MSLQTASRTKAVVLGASIAGSIAARVLADHFDEVVVIDRDTVTDVATARKGTPQAGHAHGLHGRGHQVVAELFPGILQEATAAGMGTRDIGEMRWYFDGVATRTVKTGLTSIVGPRSVLENLLRQRVSSLDHVQIRDNHRSIGLLHCSELKRVLGVRVRDLHGEYDLEADLVVDATGRGSSAPLWLEELGYGRPWTEEMKIRLAYTTARFRRHPGTFGPPQAINPVASPTHPRGAFFGQTPAGDVVVSLTGICGDTPPREQAEFLQFVRSLPVPELYEALTNADQLSDANTFQIPSSRWRHFEQMPSLPRGFVAVGDSVCAFNPVYGQGMTVAALQAVALNEALQLSIDPDPIDTARRIARTVSTPWEFSTEGDLEFEGVPGRRTRRVRFRNRYRRMVLAATRTDPEVTRAYMRVVALVDHPRTLWAPSVMYRVLRSPLNARRAQVTVDRLRSASTTPVWCQAPQP